MSLGSFTAGATIIARFNTRSAGVLTTLVGGAVAVYKNGSSAESTSGVTLTTDFDGVTGLHLVTITTTSDPVFYVGGSTFTIVLTAGTVGGESAAGLIVDDFALLATATLAPSTGAVVSSAGPGDRFVVKDPDATIPRLADWTAYLASLGAGVTIAASAWTQTGPDTALTLANDAIVTGGLQTQVLLGAGTLGARYTVTNRITTSSSPAVIDERSFDVLIEDQ